MPLEREIRYSFSPSGFALVNKNSLVAGAYNVVDTAEPARTIAFPRRARSLLLLVLAGTIALAWLVNGLAGLGAAVLSVPLGVWLSHHLFGRFLLWPLRRRLLYFVTDRELGFDREDARDAIPLLNIRRAWVIPTLTQGLLGYHNVGVLYQSGPRLAVFFLYGVPNRDLARVLALLQPKESERYAGLPLPHWPGRVG